MNRAIVKMNGGDRDRCNLAADSLKWEDEYLYIYNGEKLVGVFDVSIVLCAYLSTKSEG